MVACAGASLVGHQPFDVLHHHDGVVHQQADGQHHAEQRSVLIE
jgi:hypothetical protein